MRNFLLLSFTAIAISFIGCGEKDDVSEWRDANIAAYRAITQSPEYKELNTASGPGGLYYKVLKTGSGTEYPLQTSNVKVLYTGKYYDGSVFDSGSGGNDIPVLFTTSGVVRGFGFALQNMVVGDKWEIWVPYYLGYGEAGLYDQNTYRTVIKGYTTLVFELELVEIIQYP